MGDEGLGLEIHSTAGRGAGIQGGGDVDGTGGVVAAESDWHVIKAESTAAARAARKGSGNVLFRFPARRRIPAQALALKKYLGGIGPVSSTRHNEHTAAALGQAEILGVEHPPRDCSRGSKDNTSVRPFSPWRFQRTILAGQSAQKASEGVVAGGQGARHVFPIMWRTT